MKEHHRTCALLLLMGLMAAPGCASWTPGGRFRKRGEANSDSESDINGRFSENKPKQPVRSAFKNASSAVATALTIKPKVIPADDPTNLAYKGTVDAEVYGKVARLYEERGNYEEALKQYDRALKIAPRDASTLVGMARVHDRLGNLRETENYYRRAITANPNNPLVANDLGLFYARQRRFPQAVEMLNRAVSLDPQRPLYRNNLAAALVDARQIDQALQHLLAVNPPAVAHYNLGYMLHERGQADPAMHHFTQAVLMNPTMREAQEMIAQLSSRSESRSANRMAEPPRGGPAPAWQSGSTNAPPMDNSAPGRPPFESRPW